jgi:hypothetical protein
MTKTGDHHDRYKGPTMTIVMKIQRFNVRINGWKTWFVCDGVGLVVFVGIVW